MRFFAESSPLVTWGFFYLFLHIGFGGPVPQWLNDALPNEGVVMAILMGAIIATAIVGGCASYIYFRRESSKLSRKILYFTSFVHGLLFSGFLFCFLLDGIDFFGSLGGFLQILTFPTVWCWLFAIVVHYVFVHSDTKGDNDE